MPENLSDAASRLGWGLRRYAWLIVLLVVGITALSVLSPRLRGDEEVYEASALVVATQLTIRADQVPRLASAVFTGGSVAERAVRDGDLPYAPDELIPDHARLEPVENNIVLLVEGRATDPELAARTANSAAEALVAELNRAGPGVGTFAVQDEARVPREPDVRASPALLAVVGFVGGLASALGLVGLIIVVRRPVLTAVEAAAVANAPLLATLTVPRPRRGRPLDLHRVVGLTALVKQVFPQRRGTTVFVACRGSEAPRSLVAQLVARALARYGPVALVAHADRVEAVRRQVADEGVDVLTSTREASRTLDQRPLVVDGPSTDTLDAPQFLPADAMSVLVIAKGIRQSSVDAAVRQFLPGELAGLVFTRLHATRWRRKGRRSAAVEVHERAETRETMKEHL